MNELNRDKLIEYFKSGCKVPGTMKVGMEVEHFIVDKKNMRSVNYYEEHGVENILNRLSKLIKGDLIYSENRLIGITDKDFNITIEPAAQLEISIRPCLSIEEIMNIYKRFISLLTPILNEYGYKIINLGYHPVSSINDLPLIPKKRYKYMDKYFLDKHTGGANMMKGTASVQASIDYYSEKDFINKYRLSYLLGPVIKLLTDNTPVFEGKKNEIRFKRSSQIWENTDKNRCGMIPTLFEDNFGFNEYADFIMNMPIILDEEDEGVYYVGDDTPNKIWQGKELSIKNIEHILSMAFLDVRLKKYIEIRFADSVPMEYMLSYATFIKGLFNDEKNINYILNKYKVKAKDIEAANKDIVKNGFLGSVYGQDICKLTGELLSISKLAIDSKEQTYLEPFYNIIDSKKTLAERWGLDSD